MLGIVDDLMPTSIDSARESAAAIARRQFGPSEAGQALTKALVDMLGHVLPGDVFQHVAPLLISYFLGKEHASWLGIADHHPIDLIAGPLRALGIQADQTVSNSRALSALADKVGHLLIESIVFIERGGNRPSFSIPAELRQQWGVNWTS
jgi:hypothetical protein